VANLEKRGKDWLSPDGNQVDIELTFFLPCSTLHRARKGAAMRHFIAAIIGTITTSVGKGRRGFVVTDRVMLGVRARQGARSLLVRLTGWEPARLRSARMGRMQLADAGAARLLEHNLLGSLWLRPSRCRVKPGAGASMTRF
jgi:hypothetical protein